jgi:photosystem II stability/assembly factor-like uncharacterized protein
MKQRYVLGLLLAAGLGGAGCKEDVYVLDAYSTLRYDVLKLPTPADTMKLTAVEFVSAREGFVGGTGGAIFATTDAGLTWVRRPALGTATINKLVFSSPTTGWACTSTGLYRTANGGQTWLGVRTYDSWTGAMTDVADVQLVTAQIGYAVGDNGGLYKTTNGGTTWNSLNSRRDKSYAFKAVSFTSPDSGMAVGDKRARWFTTNGGLNWDFYDDPGSLPRPYYDALRYGPRNYLLATETGFEVSELLNANGGYSLIAEPDETYHYPVYGLAAASARGPWVGVGERTIVRYHPEFSKKPHTPWANVHRADGTSFEDTYYAADFADASTFFAVGPRGLIHRFHYQ